ncbi:MAG TPA: HD domain-containing phosphohydrolase [Actinomycetota bacterium]|nr:HD domain-containing phosphohydrolase [Actinomycetota bacterium]
MRDDDLRLADLLSALSVATDLGMGQEPEKAVRGCLVATSLARAMDLPDSVVSDVFYTTLLQHVGCTAPAHETAYLLGDAPAVLPVAERTDSASRRETLALLATVGRGTGVDRVRHLARTIAAGKEGSRAVNRAVCEVGALMADRLRLGAGVRLGLLHSLERWDGTGDVHGLAGDDIALPARFTALATQVVIFDRLGGPDAALEMARRRAGGWLDPALASGFERVGAEVLAHLAEADVWAEVLEAEPRPARRIPRGQLDDVASAFADMVDLMTPFTLGHSAEVARLAGEAAGLLRLPVDDADLVRRAALLHDLGRVAVSTKLWEQPRALTSTQWEQVRLHPYHTERILTRSAVLEPLARVAGMHHERQDGSGYHHGASGAEVPAPARLLATADAYQAMTQDRPHRAALDPAAAARELEAATRAGRFDPECARAVIQAAGQRPSRSRSPWPRGLSDREVEVLRLLAGGLSNRQIAAALVISPRTAEHHVQHLYTKIDASTRAAAAMFAMEHGLLR